MDKKRATLLGVVLVVGIAAGLLLIRRPVTVNVDGVTRVVDTAALTSGAALQELAIRVTSADKVTPTINAWLGGTDQISVVTAKPVTVWMEAQGPGATILSTERTPEGMLAQVGVPVSGGDEVRVNGIPVQLTGKLPEHPAYVLQVIRSQAIALNENGFEKALTSSAASVGQALWKAGIRLSLADRLSSGYLDLVKDTPQVSLLRSRVVKIKVDGKEVTAHSAATTVGQALADAGIPLQGLDTSAPTEDKPVPENGVIEVVRVREEIELKQTTIPFKTELVADAELELDQRRIIQAGQEGIKVTRVLVRYENGKEVKRTTEAEWTAAEPLTQKTGYGTKIVIRTMDTPDGPIQYWRSARVYATSYAPCNFLLTIGRCSYTTANGSKLQKGVIGTGEAWYRLMVNQGVYVEGYGKAIVGDWGYVGGYWVDLGYSDADFINWHRNTTLYWLTPVPANIPWILPP